MRVTIEHREEAGLLVSSSKNYYVDCTVLFSEEEKAVIKVRDLYSQHILLPPETPTPGFFGFYGLPIGRKIARLTWIGGIILGFLSVFTRTLGDLAGMMMFGGVLVDLYFGYAIKKQDNRIMRNGQAIKLKALLDNPKISIWASSPAAAKTKQEELRARLTDIKALLTDSIEIPRPQTFEL